MARTGRTPDASHYAQAERLVPGPHACAPAPAASRQRIPTACPKDGRPGEGARLTQAPLIKAGAPPPGHFPATHFPATARAAKRGVQAAGPVPHPHAHTPAASRWRTPVTACP